MYAALCQGLTLTLMLSAALGQGLHLRSRAQLVGLKSAELNGTIGTLTKFNPTTGRWSVLIENAEEESVKAVKTSNLMAVDTGNSEDLLKVIGKPLSATFGGEPASGW